MSSPDEIRRMFAQVQQEFGTLDIFAANARPELATFYQKPLEITLAAWDHALDSQAKAFLVGVREAVPLMSDGGRIVAITYAPGAQKGTWQPWVAMGSAKAALESLVRYFAVALAGRGITVNSVSAGLTDDSVLKACRRRSSTPRAPGTERLDADGADGHSRGHRERGRAALLGGRGMDYRPAHLRRRRRVAGGHLDAARDPARLIRHG